MITPIIELFKLKQKTSITIVFKEKLDLVPIISKYYLDIDLFYYEQTGGLYIDNIDEVSDEIFSVLDIPQDAVFFIISPFIGLSVNDIILTFSCLTSKNYIRKVKIKNILDRNGK